MAEVHYLLQGLDSSRNHEVLFKELITPRNKYDEITIYSAFNRSESVLSIKDALTSYGKKAIVVIGIRNGSTSKQGLEALFSTGVELYVVDTGSPMVIFHPKTFVGIDNNHQVADVVIGSANFTPGGFYRNIENSCLIKLDLTNFSDVDFLDTFIESRNILLSSFDPENVIHITSKAMIKDLFEEGRLVDENSFAMHVTNIGIAKGHKKPVKRMALKTPKKEHKSPEGKVKPTQGAVILNGSFAANLVEVWKSGPLNERDLTIPKSPDTNPTGSMLLKKGVYNIDFQSYFRDTVFKDLTWSNKNNKKPYFEYADANFHFIIDGIQYPPYKLTIQYDKRTDTKSYKQRNGNTHLHWNTAKDIIKNRELLGKTLTLYKIVGKDDEFVIEIKDNED